MNTKLCFTFVVCFLAISAFGFEDPDARCHHDHVMDSFYDQHPERMEGDNFMRNQMKEAANAYLTAHRDGLQAKSALSIVRIPVVWHVLHTPSNSDTLVTEANINADMAYLNEWFSASNTHFNAGSSYWQNDIAVPSDFQIEFVLASTDPNGNPTNGITYRETSVANTCGDYEIFRENEGGITAWNTLHYMNVWTCAITHAAGYAYLPGGSTHERDGMVMAYQHIGSSYISGSILAHEMGHWLGLRHTFQSCAAPGDNIDDTPPSGANGFDYVTGNAACPGQGGMTDADFQQCGNIVMIQNCMDYNYEHCKSYFSKGQVALMRSWLDNPNSIRGGLGSSPGLQQGATSATPTRSPSSNPSNTPTRTRSSAASNTPTRSRTSLASNTPTRSGTSAPSNTPTRSPTSDPSNSPTRTATPTRSQTSNVSATRTPTRTSAASNSPTRSPTSDPSNSSTRTRTPATSATPTRTSTSAASNTPSRSPTSDPSTTPSAAAPVSPSRTSTSSPSRSATRTRTIPTQSDAQQIFRNLITSEHNRVRSEVNPPAVTPLTPLSYSNTIESNARAHADQCVYGFDSSNYGKNLYVFSGDQSSNPDFTQSVLSAWEAKKDFYTLTATGSSCQGDNCGSYIQMIWDHASYPTTELGCAMKTCSTGSPWGTGYGGLWTMLYCNYGGPGNYIGLLPYVPCDTCSTSCDSTCSEDECGIVSTPCGDLDCGCCDDPCSIHECGTHMNACQETISCGNCVTGSSCEVLSTGNVCVVEPVCSHEEECIANNRECDFSTFCSVTETCGHCPEGERCENFLCQDDPCFGCPVNSECSNDLCICLDGFVEDNLGNCIAPSSGGGATPDYTNMLTQIFPSGAGTAAVTIPGTEIVLNNHGPHVIDWSTSLGVVDAYTTNSEVTVSLSSGEFGYNIRTGQDGGSRSLDCIRWHVKNIGGSPSLSICWVYYGTAYCGSYNSISFPTSDATVRVTMGLDASDNILTTFRVNGGSLWSSYVPSVYYPALGSISYFISPSVGHNAVLSQAVLATTTTMSITLSECIDDSEWEDIFYQLSGADPTTTSVAIRGDNDQTDCAAKSLTTGKALVSGFTTVITSGSVAASTLSSTVASSTGSAAASLFSIGSATPVTGIAGAAAAGFPTTIAALGGSVVQAPGIVVTAAGAATGGGAVAAGGASAASGGGLSGTSIAGIVVGSVAAAVLLLSATTVLVVALIAIALYVASREEEEEAPQADNRRKSVRNTIKGFFGGVDVMSNDPNGHQSITARSPAF